MKPALMEGKGSFHIEKRTTTNGDRIRPLARGQIKTLTSMRVSEIGGNALTLSASDQGPRFQGQLGQITKR